MSDLLKQEIDNLIAEGFTDDEIFNLMEERYGNYVILRTDINENKSLFLIPLMVLLISILLVTTYTIKRSR